MKQVQVLAFCENHPGQEATEEVTARVGGSKPKTVDVCDECLIGIVGPFMDLMSKGVEVDAPLPEKKSKKATPHVCPLCGHATPTRSALGQHLHTKHDTGFNALAEAGTPVPYPAP